MRTLIALAAVAGLGLLGCDRSEPKKNVRDIAPKTTDLGTGLNAVERTYAHPASEMIEVVANALKSFDLRVESDTHDLLGGEIVARRADGHKVTAKITSHDEGGSDVSIRVAPGNRNLADMIQDRIGQKLSELPAK
jgi:hypothetical protein